MRAYAGEQAELAARGIPDGVIAAGALLPDADLLDPFGAPADDTSEIWNVKSAFAALPT